MLEKCYVNRLWWTQFDEIKAGESLVPTFFYCTNIYERGAGQQV